MMSEEQIKNLGIPAEGVYVSGVSTDGGAYAAGIRKGDVITKVNNVVVNAGLQMSAQLAGFRPGDKVPITYIRGGKEYSTMVILKKKAGTFEDVAVSNIGTKLGGDLATLDKDVARKEGIEGGVLVKKITPGGALSRTRINEGFVITSVNGQDITSLDELTKVLSNVNGTVSLEGVYPGYDGTYKYPLNLEQ
jgi:S1-C subfamily serine protease